MSCADDVVTSDFVRRRKSSQFLHFAFRDGRFEVPECGLLIPPARAQAQPLGEILEQPQLLCVATLLALVLFVPGLRCRTGNGIADKLSDAQRQSVAVIGGRGKGDYSPAV